MTLYQLRAFGFWMVRKTLRFPLLLVNQATKLLDLIATAVYDDGFIGVVLGFLVSMMGFILGFITGGIYLECTKEPSTIVEVGRVAMYGFYSGIATAVTIFFYTCWYCFKQEQNELIEHLKDTYRE